MSSAPVTLEQIRERVINQDRLFIVVLLSRRSVSVFMVDLEYRHYIPDTPHNDLFEMFVVRWEDMQWVIIEIPKNDLEIAKKVAQKYDLEIQLGHIPVVVDSNGPKQFPVQGENVATLINLSPGMSPPDERAMAEAIFQEFSANVEKLRGTNLGKPVLIVQHKNLRPWSRGSILGVFCPACLHGGLKVQQDASFKFKPEDQCDLCGQLVIYEDVDTIGGIKDD